VLDEVASVDQVRTVLVAPPGCAFVVAGRNTLIGLGGASCNEVVGLASDEALALLETLIGAARVAAERRAAEALVSRCAGHPLAVRALGARLAARPDWGLEPALRHLREVPEPRMRDALLSDANSTPLERAYRRLSPEQAPVFRSGAEFDGPWIPVGAAAVPGGMRPRIPSARRPLPSS